MMPLSLKPSVCCSRWAEKRYAEGQVDRIRKVLKKNLAAAYSDLPNRAYVVQLSALLINEDLENEIIRLTKSHFDDETGQRIFSIMRSAPLDRSVRFWLQAFEAWPPTYQGNLVKVFGKAFGSDKRQALRILGEGNRGFEPSPSA